MIPRPELRFLTVQMQHGVLVLWALVDPLQPKEQRTINIFGTGGPAPDTGVYIGTVQDGGMVWHVFQGEPIPMGD